MTGFQQKQSNSTFFENGRKSYLLDVPGSNNPYTTEPHRSLWDKGWRAERSRDTSIPSARTPRNNPDRKRSGPAATQQPSPAQSAAVLPAAPAPVNTQRLVNRFQNKYQTRAHGSR